jgi:hypothetical protein
MYIHKLFFVNVNLNVDLIVKCTQYLSHYTSNLKQYLSIIMNHYILSVFVTTKTGKVMP